MLVTTENTPYEEFLAHRKAVFAKRESSDAPQTPDLEALELLPSYELAIKMEAAAVTLALALKGIEALTKSDELQDGDIGQVREFAVGLQDLVREMAYRVHYDGPTHVAPDNVTAKDMKSGEVGESDAVG